MKVLQTVWFSPTYSPLLGVVVGEDEHTGKKKAYIGPCVGRDADADTKFICDHGAKFELSMFTLLQESKPKEPDYRAILKKCIKHIGCEEGITFIDRLNDCVCDNVKFSKEEAATLVALDQECLEEDNENRS